MVRRRLSDSERAALVDTLDANTTLTDVVGTIVRVEGGEINLETRKGEATVSIADVVVAKRVPPAPVRRQRGWPEQ